MIALPSWRETTNWGCRTQNNDGMTWSDMIWKTLAGTTAYQEKKKKSASNTQSDERHTTTLKLLVTVHAWDNTGYPDFQGGGMSVLSNAKQRHLKSRWTSLELLHCARTDSGIRELVRPRWAWPALKSDITLTLSASFSGRNMEYDSTKINVDRCCRLLSCAHSSYRQPHVFSPCGANTNIYRHIHIHIPIYIYIYIFKAKERKEDLLLFYNQK